MYNVLQTSIITYTEWTVLVPNMGGGKSEIEILIL